MKANDNKTNPKFKSRKNDNHVKKINRGKH